MTLRLKNSTTADTVKLEDNPYMKVGISKNDGVLTLSEIVHYKFANPVICNNRVFSRFKLYIIYNFAFKKIFVKDICIQQNVVGILNIHY
mgnify:CR=1 FL=1